MAPLMDGRAILHIGPHKTATSALQSAFATCASSLATHGVVYSAVGRHGDAHHELAWTLFDDEHGRHVLAADRSLSSWDDVRDELATLDRGQALLLSSEDFCFYEDRELTMLAAALDQVAVDVVFGVRDPAVAVPSAWQESVKWGEQRPLDEAVDELLADREIRLLPLLDRWQTHLPEARFRSFVVPAARTDADLFDNAARAVGVPAQAITSAEIDGEAGNASLSWVHAEALRAVSAAVDPAGDRVTLHDRQRLLRPLAFLQPGGRSDRPRLTPEQAEQAVEVRAAVLEGLATRGVELFGDPESLAAGEVDAGVARPSPPLPSEVIEALRRMRGMLPPDDTAVAAIDGAIEELGPSIRVRAEMLSERLVARSRARARSLRARLARRG